MRTVPARSTNIVNARPAGNRHHPRVLEQMEKNEETGAARGGQGRRPRFRRGDYPNNGKMATDKVKARVLIPGVGGINESVTLAGRRALIVGFNVRANPQARELARRDAWTFATVRSFMMSPTI